MVVVEEEEEEEERRTGERVERGGDGKRGRRKGFWGFFRGDERLTQ